MTCAADVKVLIQRVTAGRVSVDRSLAGEIRTGFVALVGVRHEDAEADAIALADRTTRLRIFSDPAGKMNLALADVDGSVLAISQFTLYADMRKGNRPSFVRAAQSEVAEALYETYVAHLRETLGADRVATGVFGAMMQVEIHNDGPVTIELTTDD